MSQSPRLVLVAMCLDESAQINNSMTGNDPPIGVDPATGRYPQILVGVVARRVAIRAALRFGLSNAGFQASLDRLIAGQADDNRTIAEWRAALMVAERARNECRDLAHVPKVPAAVKALYRAKDAAGARESDTFVAMRRDVIARMGDEQ